MKANSIVIAALCCWSNLSFSQNTDSLKTQNTAKYKNEFGISLVDANFYRPYFQYKRKMESYSIRAVVYSDNRNYQSLYYGITDTTSPTKPNVQYHVIRELRTLGGKIGIEKGSKIFESTKLFYGFDVGLSHIKDRSKTYDLYLKTDSNNTFSSLLIVPYRPTEYNLNGYSFEVAPIVGLNQRISNHFSASVELNLLFKYLNFNTNSRTFEYNSNVKVFLSYQI